MIIRKWLEKSKKNFESTSKMEERAVAMFEYVEESKNKLNRGFLWMKIEILELKVELRTKVNPKLRYYLLWRLGWSLLKTVCL